MTNINEQPPTFNLEGDFDIADVLSRMQNYLTRNGMADFQTEENEVPAGRSVINTGQTLLGETPAFLWDLNEVERQTRPRTPTNLLGPRDPRQNPPAPAEENWDREAREAPAPSFTYGRGYHQMRQGETTDAYYSPETIRENRREWYRRVHRLGVNYPHHPQKGKTIRL